MARVSLLDGLVLIGSCDKIVPVLLMAAARVDIPAIILTGGYHPPFCYPDQDLAADERRYFRGPAKVFECEEEAIHGILNQEIAPGECIIIRNEGPKGGPGMREMSFPGHLLQISGLGQTCALVTDDRFSGTNYDLLIKAGRSLIIQYLLLNY